MMMMMMMMMITEISEQLSRVDQSG